MQEYSVSSLLTTNKEELIGLLIEQAESLRDTTVDDWGDDYMKTVLNNINAISYVLEHQE